MMNELWYQHYLSNGNKRMVIWLNESLEKNSVTTLNEVEGEWTVLSSFKRGFPKPQFDKNPANKFFTIKHI